MGDVAQIHGLSRDALRSKMGIYAKLLKGRYNASRRPPKKEALKLLEDEKHWLGMSKEEMESAMIVEYVKYSIGKTSADDVGELLGLKQ